MSLYNGPPRGGSRGGRDQFNWENVKSDKDREFYLGHSVNALQGRWQKGKDVYWYTREKADQDANEAAELLAVKQREEDLMAEALGIKPKTIRAPKQPSLDQRDMAQLMQRGEDEEDEDPARQAERIKGLGYRVNAVTGAGEADREVLAGTAPAQSAPAQQQPANGGALPLPPSLNAADQKRMLKLQKKAEKEKRRAEKKEKRKAKKAHKKAKKEAKQAKQERKPAKDAAPSSSGSGSSEDASGDEAAAAGAGAGAADGPKRTRHDSPTPEEQPLKRAKPVEEDSRRRQGHDSESPPLREDGHAAAVTRERSPIGGADVRRRVDERTEHRRERSPAHHRADDRRRDGSPPRHRGRDRDDDRDRDRDRYYDSSRHDRSDRWEEGSRDRYRRDDRRERSPERRRQHSRSPERRR
ncbi:g6263 [Coccomyxa viridis]|uniref:G6263 protein n=1 Tax=Coccomyxa viridis TaxID=1274662 RepID=A0ABP1FXA8_9CHLO